MNWYPTIYHPITRQPINLFSDEINELLDQGFTEQNLLNSQRVVYTTPFHDIPDVDYEMMMNLNFDQLRVTCNTNKYAYKLCQNKEFWLNKFRYDNLFIPDNLPNNTNWLKAYYMLKNVTAYMRESSENDLSEAILGDIDIVINLINKYNLGQVQVLYRLSELKEIVFWKKRGDNYTVEFAGIENRRNFIIMEITVDKQILINFLYEAMMTGGVTKLTES